MRRAFFFLECARNEKVMFDDGKLPSSNIKSNEINKIKT